MISPDNLQRLLASLPAEPVKRGRAFERVCKWFLESDPVYRTKLAKVWLWDQWPGRWGADAGIDLVAETKDGQLWVIQAKAHSPGTTITKADVDTFLSEFSHPLDPTIITVESFLTLNKSWARQRPESVMRRRQPLSQLTASASYPLGRKV